MNRRGLDAAIRGADMAIGNGDKVKVEYTGKLADGSVFDTSKGRRPLEFVVGSKTVIPGFEKAVIGRDKGDAVTVVIPAAEAYGESDPELVFTVARSQMPETIPLEPGTPIQLSNEQGQMDVVITEVGPQEVTLDANHPLAGKDLTFDIEIVDVEPAKN